jgi:ankyrin repeat protein
MEGWNFLHMALRPPRDRTPIHVVEYLLQIGVDANAKDCYGNTPRIYAARGYHRIVAVEFRSAEILHIMENPRPQSFLEVHDQSS